MPYLYYPPSLRRFEPRRVLLEAALSHVCVAYDLAGELRPRLVVDLGAGAGEMFFGVCQSMQDHDIDGVCFAVDPWRGDTSTDENDEEHSLSINHHARSFYRGITYLLKVEPGEALQHFAENSVDLLRIDAARLGVPLAELLSGWLPRLAAGGVLLCPGLADPSAIGTRAAFQDAAREHGAFVLELSGGLGILRKQPSPGSGTGLLALLASGDPKDAADLARFYAHVALHHSMRRSVRHLRFNLGRKKSPAA